jgi:RND superfamily putative drug exporter
MGAISVKSPRRPTGVRRNGLSRGAIIVGILGVVFLLVGLGGSRYQAKMSQVEKNDNSAFLPSSAESTEVSNEAELFQSVQVIPGFVVFQRLGGLTNADRKAIQAEVKTFQSLRGVAADQVGTPQFASDGATASIAVPLVAKTGKVSVSGDALTKAEKGVLRMARSGAPPGLAVHSAGPGGLLAALIDSFGGIDGTLLLAAILVVVVILLIVYRSPFLWIFPLIGAVVALGTASLIVYTLAKHNALTLNGQSTGILSVLVLGAGTDYALLLTSRYREELHNFDDKFQAMITAWRRASAAIVASGSTVILGVLTLTLGELNSDRSLGPVLAIGIACTVVSMLTFLPFALAVMPRAIFWPRVPRADRASDVATSGPWSSIAAFVGRNDRRSWLLASVALGICAIGIGSLKANDLPISEGFTNHPDAVIGQNIYDAHFARGTGAPAEITTNAGAAAQVIDTVSHIRGVSRAPGSVCVAPDYAKLAAFRADSHLAIVGAAADCPPRRLSVSPVNGRLLVDATLTSSYDTIEASQTIVRIRSAVHAIAGARALVGGQAATTYDTNQAARHDRNLVIPIVLVVIVLILMALLRAVIAPILLIASVVLSFSATLGISAFFFNHVFHFVSSDPSFPLFVFVFLVALGVDYNIFLMTRVREEAQRFGTRDGILRGLAVTGGVITSAGLVLAATFAVLRVIPLVFLSELGFAVALGVLLDTIVVRSLLVPALSHDIGRMIWWPSRLARAAE